MHKEYYNANSLAIVIFLSGKSIEMNNDDIKQALHVSNKYLNKRYYKICRYSERPVPALLRFDTIYLTTQEILYVI